jgi:hypothetical protein
MARAVVRARRRRRRRRRDVMDVITMGLEVKQMT